MGHNVRLSIIWLMGQWQYHAGPISFHSVTEVKRELPDGDCFGTVRGFSFLGFNTVNF